MEMLRGVESMPEAVREGFSLSSGRELRCCLTDMLANNEVYARSFNEKELASGERGAVATCMDARLDVHKILGLEEGEAHVIRNAGGVVTDDVIRSLLISQRLLGTREIILIHHTDYGMVTFQDDDLKETIQREVGLKPPFALESFPDLEEDVRQSMQRVQASPFIPHKNVRGFVYEVETGRLREVHPKPGTDPQDARVSTT
jgi:carbonic anhydrase